MVFCNLLSVDNKTAIYAIGGSPDDLSGELIVDSSDGSFEVTKEPEKSKIYNTHVRSMLNKYRKSIDNGDFKQKMAYQIG